MPFVLAVFALLHLIALHTAGSSNPLGITSNVDKLSMHPYYSFKDLITVFAFLLMFTLFVFFSPDKLGQGWPTMLIILVLINIYFCAICWNHIHILKYVKIYSKTINLIYNQDLRIIYYISIFIILFFIEVTYYYVIIMTLFILNLNLNLNKSKVWNQQVTYTINYI
jgi:quinol-cytochrome oxidoreductase complex cytochrome b subunit